MIVLQNINPNSKEYLRGHFHNMTFREKVILLMAFLLASVRHKYDDLRRDGNKYTVHLFFVASIARDLNFSVYAQVAGLLHDSVEHGKLTYAEIKKKFGSDAGKIIVVFVEALTEDKSLPLSVYFKKIAIASSLPGFWEIFVVKLIDRLHNLVTPFGRDRQSEIAYLKETLGDFYLMCLVCRKYVPFSRKDLVDDLIATVMAQARARLLEIEGELS